MNYSRKYGRACLGMTMAILLLLAACLNKQTGMGGGTAPVETVRATATTAFTPTATLTPYPTPTAGQTCPFQVLPSSLAWHPSGRWLAYASSDGRVWLRDFASEMAQQVEGIEGFEQADLRLTWGRCRPGTCFPPGWPTGERPTLRRMQQPVWATLSRSGALSSGSRLWPQKD